MVELTLSQGLSFLAAYAENGFELGLCVGEYFLDSTWLGLILSRMTFLGWPISRISLLFLFKSICLPVCVLPTITQCVVGVTEDLFQGIYQYKKSS